MASKEKQDTKESETKKDNGKLLKIDRKDAVSLVGALGFHAAHKASNQVLALRLKKLSQYLETFKGTFTGDQAELKDKVLKAGWEGFEIVGTQPTRAGKASGQGNKKGKPAEEKGAKDNKPMSGEKIPARNASGDSVDAWGSRVGSMTAKVNTILQNAKGPMKMKDLMQKVKSVGAFSSHMKKMERAGHVKCTKEGFIVIGK